MTLFISDIRNQRRGIVKTGFVYMFESLFLIFFGAVYEHYSHEVYSYFMLYAFAVPLVGGALPVFILAFSERLPRPRRAALNLYHSGIASLTVGCVFKGVLEIYGTTNSLIKVYWITGCVFLVCGIILYRQI